MPPSSQQDGDDVPPSSQDGDDLPPGDDVPPSSQDGDDHAQGMAEADFKEALTRDIEPGLLDLDLRSDKNIPAPRPTPPPSGPAPQSSVSPVSEPPASVGRRRARLSSSLSSSGIEAPEVTGRLVVIVEDGSEGRQIDLFGDQLDLGRSDGDLVMPEDRYMSPRHARFFRKGGAWYLRDLNSTNGVYRRLNEPLSLNDGDTMLLGLEVLKFEHIDHGERGLGQAMEHGTLVFGSPAVTRRARLCQRTLEGITRDVYHLVATETTIGREVGDIVFTSDPFMSRRHAVVRWDDASKTYILADLGSSNGTYLAICDDVRMEDGDFIRIGQHLFRVDLPPSGTKTD